jgi:hypothetical protein
VKLTVDDIASRFDIFLSSHKDENVTRRMRDVDLEGLLDCRIDVIFARSFAEQDIDGESSTGNGETRCIVVKA